MNYRIKDLDLRHAYEEGYEAGREGLGFICDNCYQPRHLRSRKYYLVRGIARAIFWTALIAATTGYAVGGIWILWSYVSAP